MADQHAVFGHGDDARLLADDDGNGIRVLGNAQAGAVAGAHVLAEVQVVGKGQYAARRLDTAVFNDGRAVMQGGTLVEDGAQHLQVDGTVHRRTGADDLREVGVPLQHDEGTCLGL